MKNAVFLISILVTVLLISGCTSTNNQSQSNNAQNIQSQKSFYENDIYGFSIEYPASWQVEEGEDYDDISTIVAFIGPTKNNFRSNINIKTENAPRYSLKRYVEETKQSLSLVFASNDYILLNNGSLNINNEEAYFLEYAYSFQGYPLKIRQIILIKNENAYIITYASLQSTFQDYIDDFEISISTFKFIN